MLHRFLFALLLAAAPVALADDAKDVEAAERGWAKGITANDFSLLDKVLSDSLMYSHSNGLVDTKASYIGSLKSGKSKYFEAKYTQLDVKVLDEKTAYVTARGNFVTLGGDGQKQFMDLKLLHIFRKEGGQWKMVAHQSARMPAPAK
jgi:ketosteroid isomerase-like protein